MPKGGARLIRLGIVDDHPVFRLGMIRTFEREPDLEVLWELGTADKLPSILEACPVDVVLMDLNLGSDQDALAATTAIRESFESVKVIVISASLDWDAASAARAAGASGYLPKDLAIADMVAAIRGLASPDFGRWTFNNMLEVRPAAVGSLVSLRRGLTAREQEVLVELRRGRTNKQIAARLGVSLTTVNKHVQQVLKKLHVRTRAQAVAMIDAEANGRPFSAGERTRRESHHR
ncbi:MAG TPA: response regulator transcription factor [Candidatus Dormibacteraeota bacterium]|nr:response regulator transcription factor [Candidatus Dormibacteraeota bacterium]